MKGEPISAKPIFRSLSVFILLTSFTLILSPTAQAFTLSPQYDVNKYWWDIPTSIDPYNTSDQNMCWAAAAANVLTYTGWAVDVTDGGDLYPTEYDAYINFWKTFRMRPGRGIWLMRIILIGIIPRLIMGIII